MKPEGYSTVSPYLVADGAQRVIDFAKDTFDAVELRRYDLPVKDPAGNTWWIATPVS